MDSNSEINQNLNTEPEASKPIVQNLSSEESYISDYEILSKKPPKKFPYLWVILGTIIFLIIVGVSFFFLTNNVVLKF
jgi:hypothetical protein